MFLPNKAFELFQVSKESVDSMREELASLRAERDSLARELASAKANFEWLRVRVNSLEVERAQLFEKVSGVKTAVPEIARQLPVFDNILNGDLFNDLGDEKARKLGLPVFEN